MWMISIQDILVMFFKTALGHKFRLTSQWQNQNISLAGIRAKLVTVDAH